MRLPGLGPKTARRIWKELGVTTLAELKQAAEQERLRGLTGLGAKSEEKILKALAEEPKDPRDSRRLLGDGLPVLLELVEELRQHPAAVKVSEAGSARRRRETFRDLDVIATSTDPPALIDAFTTRDNVADVVAKGDTKATVITNEGFRLDLRVVPPESYGNLLQHFTGSKDHNVALREDAVRRGLSVSEYAVTNTETGETFTAADEEELYAHLGYAYIPPELRENGGELEAARRERVAEAGRAHGSPRRPSLALDVVRRQGDDRGDGAGGAGARARVPRAVRSLAAPARRPAAAAVGGDRRAQRAAGAVPDPEGDRGEHPRERRDRHRRRPARAARLGDGLGALELRQRPDRPRARGDAEPPRRLHRPRDEPPNRRPQPVDDRGREDRRGGARDRDLPRDQLAAGPARPPRRARAARRARLA